MTAAAVHGVAMADISTGFFQTAWVVNDLETAMRRWIKIIEDRASVRALFKMVAGAAAGWDGSEPIWACEAGMNDVPSH